MLKEKLRKNIQRDILSLEEAIDLKNFVSSETSKQGVYYFLNFQELLGNWYILENCDLFVGKHICGCDTYAVRKPNDTELEIKQLGVLSDHPQIIEYIDAYEKLKDSYDFYNIKKNARRAKKLSSKYLTKYVKDWFNKYSWHNMNEGITKIRLENGIIPPEESKRIGFKNDNQRFEEFLENRRRLIKDFHGCSGISYHFDKKWKLGRFNFYPRSIFCFEIGIPDQKDLFVLYYHGKDSLEQYLMDSVIKPKSLGNGIVVMNEDRIPKYLKRTLGLEGKSKI